MWRKLQGHTTPKNLFGNLCSRFIRANSVIYVLIDYTTWHY